MVLLGDRGYTHTFAREESDGISKFNLIWLGTKVPENKIANLKNLCKKIKEYQKIAKEKNQEECFEINIWTEAHSFEAFKDIPECDDLNGKDIHSEKNINVYSIESLMENEAEEKKILYDFYINKGIYAAASDHARIVALQNHGGCYMDLGFEKIKDDFFTKHLQRSTHKNYMVITGGAHYSEEPSLRSPTDKNGEAFLPYNGFICANKEDPILKKIDEEILFKNKFALKHMHIIEAIYENCGGAQMVMAFIGQHSITDIYYELFRNNKTLFNNITTDISHTISLPYSGTNSWNKERRKNCGLFIANFYAKLHDENYVTNIQDHKFGIDRLTYNSAFLQNSSKTTKGLLFPQLHNHHEHQETDILSEVVRDVLHSLIRFNRKNPELVHPLLEHFNQEKMEAIQKNIAATKKPCDDFLSKKQVEKICASQALKDTNIKRTKNSFYYAHNKMCTDFQSEKKITRTDISTASSPMIITSFQIKNNLLNINMSHLLDEYISEEVLGNADATYYGHYVVCKDPRVGDIFVPLKRLN
jgi:hypothetical protein